MRHLDIRVIYQGGWTIVDAAASILQLQSRFAAVRDNPSSSCDNTSLIEQRDDTQSSDSHVPGLITTLLQLIEREDYDAIAKLKLEPQTTDQLPPAQETIDTGANVKTTIQGAEQKNQRSPPGQPNQYDDSAQKTPCEEEGEELEELTSWQVLRVKTGGY